VIFYFKGNFKRSTGQKSKFRSQSEEEDNFKPRNKFKGMNNFSKNPHVLDLKFGYFKLTGNFAMNRGRFEEDNSSQENIFKGILIHFMAFKNY